MYCGSSTWKLASLSSINTRSRFSSSVDTPKDKDRNGLYNPIFLKSNVALLKSKILKARFSSSDANVTKSTGFFGPDAVIDKTGKVNRWSMFVPAFLTHLCLGAPYGWSAISASLTREFGFVASSASDWGLDSCTYPMSIMIAFGGLGAAILGKWTMKVGTRYSMFLGGALFGTAFMTAGAGVTMHSLPLLYLGNFIAGVGYGCSYTPPIQALIDWFPDKRGLASGVVIAGFGSGALFFTPAMNAMMQKFSVLPQYLGNSIQTVTEGGKLFTQIGDKLTEVVYATNAELAKLPYDLAEGYYVVGSGNTGVGSSLMAIGGIYAATIMASSLMIRKPAAGYIPAGWTPPASAAGGVEQNVNTNMAMKTPQFWLLFSTSTLLATGGMGLISVAKPMIGDIFTKALPHLVTASFASAYLMAMASGNLGGRIGWAGLSDKIGRRNIFHMFTIGSVPLFLSLPYCINQVVTNPDSAMAPLYLGIFCASTVASISVLGGTFAVLPAYEADLYGPKYVQAIHGRFLIAATVSTIAGPSILLNLRKISENAAIQDLLSKVDPAKFQESFGADLSQAQTLIEAKTLTITKLMNIMPQGTIDPSPFLYNNTMYTMAALVGVGAALHFMVRPVDKKYFEKVEKS